MVLGDEMESITKNKQNSDTIQKMIEKVMHQSISNDKDAITELNDGWFNALYQVKLMSGKDVILKIAPDPSVSVMHYEKNMMDSEVFFMRQAKSIGIPCPTIYGYDDSLTLCSSPYYIMEKLVGTSLEKVYHKLDPSTLKKILNATGHYTKLWNTSLKNDFFGYPFHSDLQASTMKKLFIEMLDHLLLDGKKNNCLLGYSYCKIRNLFEYLSDVLDEVKTPSFIHFDCWYTNIMVEGNKLVGFIDFERAFYGDPLQEALFRMKNPFELEGYGKTTFSDSEKIRLDLYDAYLALIMIIEDSYRHYDTEDIKNLGLKNLSLFVEKYKDIYERINC